MTNSNLKHSKLYLLVNLHFFLCLFLIFLASFTGNIYYNYLFIFLGLSFFLYHTNFKKEYIIYILVISVPIIIAMMGSGEGRFGYFLYFLSTITIGYSIVIFGLNRSLSLLYFILIVFFFIYKYLTVTDFNTQIFNGMSRNGIAIFTIWAFSLLAISNVKSSILNISVFIVFFISAFSGSRSGLIASSILLFIPILQGNKYIKVFFILILISFVIYLIYYNDLFSTVVDRINKQGLTDPGRQLVIDCYREKFNLMRAIFGINYGDSKFCGSLAVGSYALHNSYLSLYSLTGIFILFFIFIILKTIYTLFNQKRITILIVFISILLRSATDDILFFNKWDYIFWMIIFYAKFNFKSQRIKKY